MERQRLVQNEHGQWVHGYVDQGPSKVSKKGRFETPYGRVRSTDGAGWITLPPFEEEDVDPDLTEHVLGVCARCNLEVLEFTGCGCWDDSPSYT